MAPIEPRKNSPDYWFVDIPQYINALYVICFADKLVRLGI